MTRRTMVSAAGVLAAAALAVPAASQAQAPGTTTLSFFEPEAGSTFKLIDNAPKSPSKNPGSRKFRFSVGDVVIFSNPLLDKQGGTRVGTLYVTATVVSGKTFANVKLNATGSFVLNDGSQLTAAGVFSFADNAVRLPITGGSGAYVGRRGELQSTSSSNGNTSTDTITLVP